MLLKINSSSLFKILQLMYSTLCCSLSTPSIGKQPRYCDNWRVSCPASTGMRTTRLKGLSWSLLKGIFQYLDCFLYFIRGFDIANAFENQPIKFTFDNSINVLCIVPKFINTFDWQATKILWQMNELEGQPSNEQPTRMGMTTMRLHGLSQSSLQGIFWYLACFLCCIYFFES